MDQTNAEIERLNARLQKTEQALAESEQKQTAMLAQVRDKLLATKQQMETMQFNLAATKYLADSYKTQLAFLEYHCPACDRAVDAYIPLSYQHILRAASFNAPKSRSEMLNRPTYQCPHCYAADRDRLVAYYFNLRLPGMEAGNILHIAPSQALKSFLETRHPAWQQVTGDLFMEGVDLVLDITDMKDVASDSFTSFICLHVLEHVDDDRKAMAELYRILKPGGFGICVVPIDLDKKETEECLGLSEAENWRRFGQNDHVRKYARHDYIRRLTEAGFNVVEYPKEGELTERERVKLGLSPTSVLYVVEK